MKKVLIVDDEKSFLLSIVDGLQDYAEEIKVLAAHNGKEALEILKKVKVDLIVTDINMPVMDGFELLTHINNSYSSIPVIVMTAFGTEEVDVKTEKLGATSYLEKPFDIKKLADKILRCLTLGSKGHIQGISLPSFLQLLSMEKKSCIIDVKHKTDNGKLFLNKGEIIDAETNRLKGFNAAFKILGWDNNDFKIENLSQKRKETINTSMPHLIMEALRLKDENITTSEDAKTNKKVIKDMTTHKSNNKEKDIMSVQAKLKEFEAIDGFGGVGLFTPTGENLSMLKSTDFKSDIGEIGVLANNVLMNAQKAAIEMGVGRGQLVHVEAESAHFIVRCLNEGTDPLKSQPGKAHIHLVLVLVSDSSIGMAKLKVNSISKSLAEDFRE